MNISPIARLQEHELLSITEGFFDIVISSTCTTGSSRGCDKTCVCC